MTGMLAPEHWTTRAEGCEAGADASTSEGRFALARAARFREVADALRDPVDPAHALTRSALLATQAMGEGEPGCTLLRAASAALIQALRGRLS